MEKTLKCPKCGSKNIPDTNCLSIEEYGEDEIIELIHGICYDCKAEFFWNERYVRVGYEEFHIVGEED